MFPSPLVVTCCFCGCCRVQVDAVCSDSQSDVRRWRRAQIVEESSTGRLHLSYDGLSDYHDHWVSRDSSNIAPPGYVFARGHNVFHE